MAKKIEVDLTQLEELASKGYNISMCCDAIGISQSKAFRDSQIMQAIRAGHAVARQKVIDDLMSRSEADTSSAASIFLAKSLRVFDTYFSTDKPKSINNALSKISDIYVAVARGHLDQEKGDRLISYLQTYLKAYETSEIERRIDALEKSRDEY